MSAIFGFLRLADHAPAPAEALLAARSAMVELGRDGGGAWSDADAGLAQLQRYDTPEAFHESMPLAEGEFAFTAAARLDGRGELCDALAVPSGERPSTADGRLVYLAYRRWGRDCVHHLAGDWALAAWDGRLRRLFLARDAFGQTGIYYHAGPHAFAFATSLRGLFAMPGVRRDLDEVGLARHIVAAIDDGAQTVWQDVLRLPPGHLLVRDDRGVQVEQYWRLEEAREVRFRSDGEYVEAFLAAYREAVRDRLRSTRPIGSTLSSGLDSSSVTALAAEALASDGRPLVALTMVPAHAAADRIAGEHRVGDEWPRAHLVAERAGVADHVAIHASDATPLWGLLRGREVNPHEPLWSSGNAYWLAALLDEARRRELGLLLTGQHGNGGVSWSGGAGAVWALLGGGHPGAAWRAVVGARDAHAGSLAGAIKGTVLAPLARWIVARAIPPGAGPRALRRFPINPRFARRLDLGRRFRAATARRAASALDPRAERLLTLLPGVTNAGATWQLWGAAFDLDVRDPTMDQRLLELCFGIPDEQYASPVADRWLMRRAMEGWLPHEVQWGTHRGYQQADLGYRLLAAPTEIEGALAHVTASPLAAEYLDLDAMSGAWDALRHEITAATTQRAVVILLRGLEFGIFLADVDGRSFPAAPSR
jgi:asparagine synthase (glutamine-hydrolysing)